MALFLELNDKTYVLVYRGKNVYLKSKRVFVLLFLLFLICFSYNYILIRHVFIFLCVLCAVFDGDDDDDYDDYDDDEVRVC